MAAALEFPAPDLVDLRSVGLPALDPLLDESVALWQQRLDWDYGPSIDLIRRYIRMQTLGGVALMSGSRAIGYTYYVAEESKGLIGDLFVTEALAPVDDYELMLLTEALRATRKLSITGRVESQMMMLSDAGRRRAALLESPQVFPRDFMAIPLRAGMFPDPDPPDAFLYDLWKEIEQEQAARLIARVYRDHIDSEINDQYRTIAGARRFLNNLVQYPGCGSFFGPASFVAMEPVQGQLIGLCLASLVAFDVGHITQVCVDRSWQRRGIGTALLRRSLRAMARAGIRRCGLTVTAANRPAAASYEQMGFSRHSTFDAFVWTS